MLLLFSGDGDFFSLSNDVVLFLSMLLWIPGTVSFSFRSEVIF